MNKKYILLEEGLKALKLNACKLLICVGEAGFGKSFNIFSYLEREKQTYKSINAYATPLSMYEQLYLNRDKDFIIFDDLEGIQDIKIISLLKGACWGVLKKEGEVSYYSTSKVLQERGLPPNFSIRANIVLILNEIPKGFKPIIDRGLKVNFYFSFKEKLEIFEEMKVKAGIDQEVLDYVKVNCNEAHENISLRTLLNLSRLKANGLDWLGFAKETFKVSDEQDLLFKLNAEEWCKMTGLSRATYFNHRKSHGV